MSDAPSLVGLSNMMARASKNMARAMLEDAQRALYFYRGYTPIEAESWSRFNRVFHRGRKIAIKDRPVTVRIGSPSVSIRKPAAIRRAQGRGSE